MNTSAEQQRELNESLNWNSKAIEITDHKPLWKGKFTCLNRECERCGRSVDGMLKCTEVTSASPIIAMSGRTWMDVANHAP